MIPCEYQWPLEDPNDEDVAFANMHACCLEDMHDGRHRCICGETTDALRR